MSGLLLAVVSVLLLAGGYLLYGRLAARLYGLDPTRKTPAHTKYDGRDYVPAKNWLMLFGHHFSSIAGASPIIGPVIALALWGWVPALIWVIAGTVFIGGMHDFGSLMISLGRGGQSISEASEVLVNRVARYLFSTFVWLSLVLVIAVFAVLAAKTLNDRPEVVTPALGLIPIAVLVGFLTYRTRLSTVVTTILGLALTLGLVLFGTKLPVTIPGGFNTWLAVFIVYAFVASVTPVQYLLQPRDYLSAFLLIFGIGVGFIGIFTSGHLTVLPAFKGFTAVQGGAPLWPMLFVTVACGAVSGFHCLIASGTTSRQLHNERYAKRIGYGGMIAEGALAAMTVVMLATAAVKLPFDNPIQAFGAAYNFSTPFLGDWGGYFAILLLNAFILTTLDTGTRINRYITTELLGIKNPYLATGLVLSLVAVMAYTGSWKTIWPVFGASNQLLAALALLVISTWLMSRKKNPLVTLIPGVLMLATTVGALVWQTWGFITAPQPRYALFSIALLLLVLAVLMVGATVVSWVRRDFRRAGQPGAEAGA